MRTFLDILLLVLGFALLVDFVRFFLTRSEDAKVIATLQTPLFGLIHTKAVPGLVIWIVQVLAGIAIFEVGIKMAIGII